MSIRLRRSVLPMRRVGRPRSWPIRVRLGIVVLVGMASMATAIGALMFSTANALFASQARAELQRQNDSVAHEIDNLTDRAASSLLIARNSPAFERYFEVDPDDAPARAVALSDIEGLVVYLQRTFAIDEICVIDANGVEIARGVLGELAGPQDLSNEEASSPFFAPTLALDNGQVYRSTEPYMSPDTHRWVVAHSTPIVLADGRHVGLLHFELPLEWFASKVQSTTPQGGGSFLLDRDGHVLVHPDLGTVEEEPAGDGGPLHVQAGVGFPHAVAWGEPGFRELAIEMLRNGAGAATYLDMGESEDVVYQPVFDGHWMVGTELPHSVIYDSGRQLLRDTLVIAAPLLVLAVALMVWYSARLLSPLRRLSDALTAIGAGHLEQTVGISGEDEVGELGTAFDQMATDLRASLRRQAAAEAALMHRATHDPLTELPNRALLHDRLDHSVALAARGHGPFALLLMDLDRFKEVNDTLGHHAGDRLLKEVAHRLMGELRSCDMVARLGGDEFAVLLPDADSTTAPAVAKRLIEALEAPVVIDGHQLFVGASVGIAVHPVHGEDGDVLMRRADAAMYAAKRSRAGWSLATLHLEQPASERLAMIGALRTAIDSDQLVLHYQPIADCRTGQVMAFEALVRWQHPTHGLMQPDRFIPLAEETGLIRPLTRWVLGEALWQMNSWQSQGRDVQVSVNLSAHDLQDPGLPDYVSSQLDKAGVAPHRLTFELTETAVMADPTRALGVLKALSGMGIRIAIDDFGAGYSSLSYLTSFPVHELKIDGSFIRQLQAGKRHAAVVRSTIDLGHSLGLVVVAECVEDEAVLLQLVEMGCDLAQGFALGRPAPAREVRWAPAAVSNVAKAA